VTRKSQVCYTLGPSNESTYNITKQMLLQGNKKSPALIMGQSILDKAKKICCNLKKALPIAEKHLCRSGDGSWMLPSGADMEVYYKNVLSETHKLLLVSSISVSNGTDKTTEQEHGNAVPGGDCFFEGWFSFILWGPLGHASTPLVLLTTGDMEDWKKQGRVVSCEHDKERRKKERLIAASLHEDNYR
jgi:hypothetical protein